MVKTSSPVGAQLRSSLGARVQAIRFVVLDHHVTQGTHGERGQKWCEPIWAAIATCTSQQRKVFEFPHQTISNHFARKPGPSLLPSVP